jgi:uncharacterized repeat protein (TIGR01451 family)
LIRTTNVFCSDADEVRSGAQFLRDPVFLRGVMRTLPSILARLALAALLPAVGPLALAASPLVDARLSVALIQSNGQFETTAPAATAKPGDVLEYTVRYSNRGNAPAEALMPTMPIPVDAEYLPTGGGPKPTQASIDGIRYGNIPLRRQEKGADGVVRDVDVPLREYRALRWAVGTLGAGSEVTVRARVRVAPVSPLASR